MIHCDSLETPILQQQQNLVRRFGTGELHLSPTMAKVDVRSKAVVLLVLIR